MDSIKLKRLKMYLVFTAYGKAWVIAREKRRAKAVFTGFDLCFSDFEHKDLEVARVSDSDVVEVQADEYGLTISKTAAEWCAESKGEDIVCSTWWAL